MKTWSFLFLVLTFTVACSATGQAAAPNILLVMTDDQGYGDLAYHGNPIVKTPALDAFAKESVRFKQFWVSPVCTPTRASLMTGQYHLRTGAIDTYLGRAMMRPDVPTIAEYLKAAGYRTGLFGKWHLGDCYPLRPEDRGFEQTLWHHGGGLAQPSDDPKQNLDRAYFEPILTKNGQTKSFTGYCTDVFTDGALEFLQQKSDKPFFAYVAYNVPHGPYQVRNEDAVPYLNQKLTVDVFPKNGQPWATPKLNTNDIANAYGMITNLDHNFARMLKALDDAKIRDNTIVIFLTDNGPGGVRYNSGFRARKGSVYEGGVRVPMFIRYPDGFAGNREITEPAAHIDITPTLLDLAAVKPTQAKLDGISLVPLLKNTQDKLADRFLITQWHRGDVPEKERSFAIRDRQYKLVQAAGSGEGAKYKPKFELFDLTKDPFETHDLAAEKPEVVQQLRTAYGIWFQDVTKLGYKPTRIILGSEAQPEVRLTRQDWRGQNAGWNRESIGHWDVDVARAGKFTVTLISRNLFVDFQVNVARGDEVLDKIEKQNLDPVLRQTVVVELPKGPLQLTGLVRGPNDPKLRGTTYLVVKPADNQ